MVERLHQRKERSALLHRHIHTDFSQMIGLAILGALTQGAQLLHVQLHAAVIMQNSVTVLRTCECE